MTNEMIAEKLGEYYSKKFNGKVWSFYDEDEKAFCIRGEGLPAHPDLQAMYPNGWSMLDHVKPSEALRLIGEEIVLVKHVTDGGAVYLTDNHSFAEATVVIRLDGGPELVGCKVTI